MRGRHLLLAALVVAFSGGCGDDEGGGGKKPAAKKPKKDRKKEDKTKPKKLEVISFIPTLEKAVPPAEAPTIRRRLKDRDFQADLTGTENRNPFQSFTLPQVGDDAAPAVTTPPVTPVKPTDLCGRNKLIASSYAIKDLTLIGIVRRGSQYFALFRDPKGIGHVVERKKCLGREKALVTAIGDTLVTIERLPEAVAGGPDPVPVTETIPLYKDEITAEDFDQEENPPPDEPATTPAPATEPAPPPTTP